MKKSRKEFIKVAHKEACDDWKSKIEKEFPELFKDDFKVGDYFYSTSDWPYGADTDNKVFKIRKIDGDFLYPEPSPLDNMGRGCCTDIELVRKATKGEVLRHVLDVATKLIKDYDSSLGVTIRIDNTP